MRELQIIFGSTILAVLISTASGLDAAHAQQPTPAQISAIRGSCRSDFMANCAGVQPGGRDALQCLEHNVAKLSPSCSAAVSAVMPAPAPPAAASTPPAAPPSAADAPSAPPTNGAAPQPSASPPAVLAPTAPKTPPRRAATTAPAHKPSAVEIAAVRQSCRSDFMAHCAGITPGGRDALLCLQKNVRRLSAECGAAVAATMQRAPAPAAEIAPAPAAPPAVAPLKVRRFILPQRRVVIVAICHEDARRLCGSVPPGGGRILECLGENAGLLSQACYTAIARVSVK
jgi:hypothetical protein